MNAPKIVGLWVLPEDIQIRDTLHGDLLHSEVLHIGLVQDDGRYAFTVQDQYGDLDYPALNPDTKYYVTRLTEVAPSTDSSDATREVSE